MFAFSLIILLADLVGIVSVDNFSVYSYVYTNASLINPNRQFVIDDLWLTNPISGGINGSLWTLTFEFWCYLFLILIGQLCKILNASFVVKFILPLIIGGFLKAIAFAMGFRSTTGIEGWLFHLLPIFLVASSLGLLKSRKTFSFISNYLKYFFVAFSSVTAVLLIYGFYPYIDVLIMPTLVMLGSYISRESKGLLARVDPSCGMYLYAYPTTQLLFYLGIHDSFINFIVTLAISIFFGYFSWVFVEKKFIVR